MLLLPIGCSQFRQRHSFSSDFRSDIVTIEAHCQRQMGLFWQGRATQGAAFLLPDLSQEKNKSFSDNPYIYELAGRWNNFCRKKEKGKKRKKPNQKFRAWIKELPLPPRCCNAGTKCLFSIFQEKLGSPGARGPQDSRAAWPQNPDSAWPLWNAAEGMTQGLGSLASAGKAGLQKKKQREGQKVLNDEDEPFLCVRQHIKVFCTCVLHGGAGWCAIRYHLFDHTCGFCNISYSCPFAVLCNFLMPKLGLFFASGSIHRSSLLCLDAICMKHVGTACPWDGLALYHIGWNWPRNHTVFKEKLAARAMAWALFPLEAKLSSSWQEWSSSLRLPATATFSFCS